MPTLLNIAMKPWGKIELMKNGYDPFLDWLKGFCILSVVFGHCLYMGRNEIGFPFWGMLAVPLFLILQAYHVFRKEPPCLGKKQFVKMLRRIFLLFAGMTALTFILCLIFGDMPLADLAENALRGGGLGPGKYYPWVYLQFFFLIPAVYWVIRRFSLSITQVCVLFTLLCAGADAAYSYIVTPTPVDELSCVRYLYLIFLGYVWSRNGIRLTPLTVALSIVSIVFLAIFKYTEWNLEPAFHQTDAWHSWCHWICYFYPAFLFIFILRWVCNILHQKLNAIVEELGRRSWGIFLMQMCWFAVVPGGIVFRPGGERDIAMMLPDICLSFAVSIIPVLLAHRLLTKINRRKQQLPAS